MGVDFGLTMTDSVKIYRDSFAEPAARKTAGYTLTELMITLVIVGVLMSFALPAYQSYIATADEGVVVSNIQSMRMFQEDYFLRNGSYGVNLANIAAIEAEIGWDPQSDDGITYSIADGDGSSYSVTAVHPDGLTVCITYPANTRC